VQFGGGKMRKISNAAPNRFERKRERARAGERERQGERARARESW
jgi:hypothetical protein